MEDRIERRRFSGPGRSGHKDHPVRGVDGFSKLAQRFCINAHLVDAAGERTFVQDADDNFFSMRRGQDRNAQVHFLAHHFDAKATVLWKTTLGDIKSGKDLDARSDGKLQRLWRRLGQNQFTIDAVAELQGVLEWLDVNVGGLFLHGLDENEIDDLDDRRVLAVGGKPIQIDFLVFSGMNFDLACLHRFLCDFLQHLAHVGAGSVDAAQCIVHRVFGRDHRHDLELHSPLEIVHCEHVRRIGHRHEKFSVQACNRHELVRLRHFTRHEQHHFFRHTQLRQIDRWRVEATAHAEGHVLLGHELSVGQDFEQAPAFRFLNADRFLELIWQQKPVFD